jgi:type II secretory pathway component PulJ
MLRGERGECGERGVALLEVIVALAILASAGTALIGLLGQALQAESELRDRERALRAAERVLTATTLLTRTDLDRRLGRHPIGELLLEVQRLRPTLYRLAVSLGSAPAVEMLVTVVYRPELAAP